MRRHLLPPALSLLLLSVSALPAHADPCTALRTIALEGTTITLAELVTTGHLTPPYGESLTGLPPFCRVTGILRPTADSEIRFEVWMPESAWNGRFLGVGNGGFAGTINFGQMATSLRRGYSTASTDTGHQAAAEDASWAFHHPEKIRDYGSRALHLTTLRARAIIAARYGKPAAHSYFDSCSNGGREGLMEAQRFPADYDGILDGAPANSWTRMLSAAIDVTQATLSDPAAYIPSLKIPAIHRAALRACDAADGVRDGILSDPARCRFDPAVLRCKSGDELDCLTAPQVGALRKLYSGGSTRDGRPIFPGFVPGSEIPGWQNWVLGDGPGAAAGGRYPVNFFRYMVTGDPAWEILRADPGASLRQAEAAVGHDLDATDPDLSAFAARGGRIILYHGWNDAAISPWNSIAYTDSVRSKLGPDAAERLLRLYMVPGMEHCAGGPGPNSFGQLGLPSAAGEGSGALEILEQWVEAGHAPGAILATHRGTPAEAGQAALTRPLCPYPQTAVYNGAGDSKAAASFTCKLSAGPSTTNAAP